MTAQTMVVFDDRTLSFRCAGCLAAPYEVRRGLMRDPEKFAAERERIEQDHLECPNFDNPRLAHNTRMMKIRIRKMNQDAERLGRAARPPIYAASPEQAMFRA